MTTLEKTQEVISERLGIKAETIQRETVFKDDLNIDSLDVVELIMELEDTFGIEIKDEDAANLVTIGDIVDFIDANL